jgi:hypothetical protein
MVQWSNINVKGTGKDMTWWDKRRNGMRETNDILFYYSAYIVAFMSV